VEKGGIGEHACVLPGDYVKFSVTDTGTGISKELREKVFDPFFKTKDVGKGTGLGLALVQGIVRQSGGYVSVESEPGQGTCFTGYLPKAVNVIVPELLAEDETHPQGTETLLVVEDEETLREAMCEFLRTLGYKVFGASSGQEALSIASGMGNINLLITDIVMPKMSGGELSQLLSSLRPNLKAIHISGYPDDSVLRRGVKGQGAAFMRKPFGLNTLARQVRDTLGPIEIVRKRTPTVS
jgi:CheY-like chemotaxis protein